jgi:hypothetical protein
MIYQRGKPKKVFVKTVFNGEHEDLPGPGVELCLAIMTIILTMAMCYPVKKACYDWLKMTVVWQTPE